MKGRLIPTGQDYLRRASLCSDSGCSYSSPEKNDVLILNDKKEFEHVVGEHVG